MLLLPLEAAQTGYFSAPEYQERTGGLKPPHSQLSGHALFPQQAKELRNWEPGPLQVQLRARTSGSNSAPTEAAFRQVLRPLTSSLGADFVTANV